MKEREFLRVVPLKFVVSVHVKLDEIRIFVLMNADVKLVSLEYLEGKSLISRSMILF